MTQLNDQLDREMAIKSLALLSSGKLAEMLVREQEENKRLTQEIESHGPEGRNYTNEQYVALRLELEQVKAERDMWNEAYSHADAGNKAIDNLVQSLHTELAAKDEVLRVISESVVHGGSWYRYQARDVLKQYPPREKGADNES